LPLRVVVTCDAATSITPRPAPGEIADVLPLQDRARRVADHDCLRHHLVGARPPPRHRHVLAARVGSERVAAGGAPLMITLRRWGDYRSLTGVSDDLTIRSIIEKASNAP
jgi:hypothetical protein